MVLFLSELIIQEGLDLVGAELYCELEDDEEEQGLQCPVKGDKTLLKAVEPALAEAMNKHGEEQNGYPQGALGNEGGDALGVKLGEHPAEIACGRGEVGTTEEYPCEQDERLAQEPTGYLHPPTAGGEAVEEETVAPLVHHKANAMHGTPKNEHQCASMPQTCYNHGEEVVEVGAHLPHPAASQGDVEIVAKPCGERDVPSAPEFGGVQRLVGKVEILPQPETHHGGYAYAHVAIAREVAIYLHAETHRGHHQFETGVEFGRLESPVVELRQIVGNDAFLEHSHNHKPQAGVD